MWIYLQRYTEFLKKDFIGTYNILHFAPEKFFFDAFENIAPNSYYPVDINPVMPYAKDTIDIQCIKYGSDMFDAIICVHVLEHIPDDQAAMTELYRVLKPNGTAYVMVPFRKNSNTFEDPTYTTPKLRKKHYGQEDHVRIYGEDFEQRLMSAGFIVKRIRTEDFLTEQEVKIFDLKKSETIFYVKNHNINFAARHFCHL